jgi:hypothetical protein
LPCSPTGFKPLHSVSGPPVVYITNIPIGDKTIAIFGPEIEMTFVRDMHTYNWILAYSEFKNAEFHCKSLGPQR